MAQITIEVSDTLAERIAYVKERLPEVLARELEQPPPLQAQEALGLEFLVLQGEVSPCQVQPGRPQRRVSVAEAEGHFHPQRHAPVAELHRRQAAEGVDLGGAVQPGADAVEVITAREAEIRK